MSIGAWGCDFIDARDREGLPVPQCDHERPADAHAHAQALNREHGGARYRVVRIAARRTPNEDEPRGNQ